MSPKKPARAIFSPALGKCMLKALVLTILDVFTLLGIKIKLIMDNRTMVKRRWANVYAREIFEFSSENNPFVTFLPFIS